MPKGPAGRNRLTSAGPLTYDEEEPPDFPRGFKEPTVTDTFGYVEPWKQWTHPNPIEGSKPDIPPRLQGVTGLHIPKENWCIIDNRRQLHHQSQVEHLTGEQDIADRVNYTSERLNTPDITDQPVIPFATDYIDAEYGEFAVNYPGLAGVSIAEVEAWQPVASLPETGSFLFPDEDGIDAIRGGDMLREQEIYSMAYGLRLVGVEGDAFAQVIHSLRGIKDADRKIFMEDLYRELMFSEHLPDEQFARNNQTVKKML